MLAEKYGYGDSGECITIADKKEVWQLEMFGSGPGKPSAIWVAQRVPDDHVGISANIPRISLVDFGNPDFFMYSSDIKERRKKLGFWDGKEPFKFWKIVSYLFPSTFGINGFVRINNMGAILHDVEFEYQALWLQTGFYFITTCIVYRWQIIISRRPAYARLGKINNK